MEQDMKENGEDITSKEDGAPEESGKNQFNYSDRAAQTFNNPLRARGVETEPPPVTQFSHTLTQWEIYDHYMANYQQEAMHKKIVEVREDEKMG